MNLSTPVSAPLPRASTRPTRPVRAFLSLSFALTITAGLLSGCSKGDDFATVNGQVISKDEYIHMLERQTVAVPGAQPTNAERLVLDQMIGNRIVLAEASKNNVMPTDEQVNKFYDVQKKLFEQQIPGKTYEETLGEQGTAPDEIKSDIRVQLAETNLYAKLLKLDEKDVNEAYNNFKAQLGLPARAQLRLVIVADKSPDYQKAKDLIAKKTKLEDVAKQVNPPQLRGNGGLVQQTQALNTLPIPWQTKIQQTAAGGSFGPLDIPNQPGTKVWIEVVKKYPAYSVPFEDAAPLVRRQLVQQKILQPENSAIRNDIIKKKMDAAFQANDKSYESVWKAVKDGAQKAGVGQAPAIAPGGVAGAPITPPGPAAGAPK